MNSRWQYSPLVEPWRGVILPRVFSEGCGVAFSLFLQCLPFCNVAHLLALSITSKPRGNSSYATNVEDARTYATAKVLVALLPFSFFYIINYFLILFYQTFPPEDDNITPKAPFRLHFQIIYIYFMGHLQS